MTTRVSVIIPAKNSEAYLAEALDSVLAQTEPPDEIIVVDDGSTDATAHIAQRYRERDSRVIVLVGEGAGVAAARNQGIRAAHGEYIAFLDSDDRWLPNKLATQLPLFASPSVGLVYSDMEFIGARTGRYQSLLRAGYHSGAVIKQLIAENFVPTSTVMVRRLVLERAGYFLENPAQLTIGEDYHLWLRIALIAEFAYSAQALVEYRVHAGQTSSRRRETYRCAHFLFSELAKLPAFTSYRALLNKRARIMQIKYIIATLLFLR